mmetsp:Transcript_13410/g.40547  ORF Transcript_13410/g.40547 Transcript_13410/m.40547 type:complete len:763 (-) Transcript_13410:349-2637(-)
MACACASSLVPPCALTAGKLAAPVPPCSIRTSVGRPLPAVLPKTAVRAFGAPLGRWRTNARCASHPTALRSHLGASALRLWSHQGVRCCSSTTTAEPNVVAAEGSPLPRLENAAGTAEDGSKPADRVAPAQPAGDPGSEPAIKSSSGPKKTSGVDYTTLLACSLEVEVPARIEQVIQYEDRSVCLRLRTLEGSGTLHLSWHTSAARLCLGDPPARGGASEVFSFGEQVNQLLNGKVLQSVSLPAAWDRVAELQVGVRPTPDPATHRLFLEVQGRHSNLLLTDGDRNILAAGYQVGKGQSSLRQLQVGGHYTLPPPPSSGLAPSAFQPAPEWQDTVTRAAQLAADGKGKKGSGGSGSLKGGLTRAFQGVSPGLVADLADDAGVSPSAAPDSLSQEQWAALHGAWLRWLARIDTNSFAAASTPHQGRISVIGVGTHSHAGSVSELVHQYHSSARGEEEAGLLREQLGRALGQAQTRLRSKIANFEKQAQGTDFAAETQKLADLLMANLHQVGSRADSVEVEDWDTGELRMIPLDPTKTGVQNAEALYKRAGKQRRAIEKVQPLLEAALAEEEYLEEVKLTLEQLGADEMDALRDIREELVAGKHMRSPTVDGALAKKAAAKARKIAKRRQNPLAAFRCFVSPGGFPIIVGRNNKQNDELTHNVAKPADIWMHARGCPGAHVILQHSSDRADAPGDADILAAADLAAYFSKKRDELFCEVITTSPKHLSRFKGARPGQVLVAREKVVLASPKRAPSFFPPPDEDE